MYIYMYAMSARLIYIHICFTCIQCLLNILPISAKHVYNMSVIYVYNDYYVCIQYVYR